MTDWLDENWSHPDELKEQIDAEHEAQRRQMEEEAMAEWRAEQEAARWDDDPSPYHGDYSEM